MLSKETVKKIMSEDSYKNRPTYWLNKREDSGLLTLVNSRVFEANSIDECREFVNNQETQANVSYSVYATDEAIIVQSSGKLNSIRNIQDFCHMEYDRLGDEIKETLDFNDIINAVRVEMLLYGSVEYNTVTKDLKLCPCCNKYHGREQYTNGSQYCDTCSDNYRKCPICNQYVFKSKFISDVKVPLTTSEKMRYVKGACKACVDSITLPYKRAGYYHDAPSDTPLFYNISRKNTPLTSESQSGTRYFGIEFEYAIDSDYLYDEYSDSDNYDSADDCVRYAVEAVLNTLSDNGYSRHIYSESDSSIEPYGYEFISNPMTLDYLMKTDIIKQVVNTTANAGFYDDVSCGMHIHVNRGSLNKYSVAKMNMILTSLEYRCHRVISKIAERENGCGEWADVVNFYEAYTCDTTEEKYACIYEQMRHNGRYVALNSQNKNTVEFRFFGATMNVSLIKDRLYFINALCSYANNHTLEQCMYVSVDTLIDWDSRCKGLFEKCGLL